MRKAVIAGLSAAVVIMTGLSAVKDSCKSSELTEGVKMQVNEKTNRLAEAHSPYLLQHKDNPVWWHEWNEAAFETARREDKPIFLSIGYSACHWCHVMEEESFEDQEVAALLNEHFIAIKVDREERPDIDQIYMSVCQAMTGSGGWPLTVVMTPDKKPFYAGTYFPKNSYYDRPGMMELLPQIAEIWRQDRMKIDDIGQKVTESLHRLADTSLRSELNGKYIEDAFRFFEQRFDRSYGGFGAAPKFPTPHNLMLLLRYWQKSGEEEALEMAEKTLEAMMNGGIFDHLGYGFHRYSTDAQWLVPHFEKMLYDQALLAMAYTEAYQATGKAKYADTVRKIFAYVLRDLQSPEGGFYSAEDADSDGGEGQFYVWKRGGIREILGSRDGKVFCDYYGVTDEGNFEGQTNILNIRRSTSEFAALNNLDEETFRLKLGQWRDKLFALREKRVHPFKDDKILTGWNGLMIAALAKGGAVLGDEKYLAAAEDAAAFVQDRLTDEEGKLLHRYRNGEAGIPAFLDDYAFTIWGLLELFESGGKAEHLEQALRLTGIMIESFRDTENGGFYFTSDDAEQLISRMKEVYDGAVPSGNSVAAYNLLRLGKITCDQKLIEEGTAVIEAFGETVKQNPAGFSMMMTALDFALGPVREIVITGDAEDNLTRQMAGLINSRFLPRTVLIRIDETYNTDKLKQIIPFTETRISIGGLTTAYVCENFQCQAPVNDVEELKALLD